MKINTLNPQEALTTLRQRVHALLLELRRIRKVMPRPSTRSQRESPIAVRYEATSRAAGLLEAVEDALFNATFHYGEEEDTAGLGTRRNTQNDSTL